MPVRDATRYLAQSVPALLAAADRCGNVEILWIDNGSSDGSFAWLQARNGPAASVHQLPDASIGAVRNFGARLAHGELLAFVDADCVVDADYFLTGVRLHEQEGPALFGSSYRLPEGAGWLEATWHDLHAPRSDGSPRWINGGNLWVPRDVFDRVGGFAEDMITGEDVEFCARVARAGVPILERSILGVTHLGNPQSLRGFYRKQVWHALGMLQTVRPHPLDRILVLTILHLALLAVAIVLLVKQTGTVELVLALVVFPWAAPLAAMIYRLASGGKVTNAPAALLLYQVYLLARLRAMGHTLLNLLHRRADPFHRNLRG